MRKRIIVSLGAALLVGALTALAALTSSEPFHAEQVSAQTTWELSELCANRYNGDLRAPLRSCASTEFLIEIPDDYPFGICANRYNGDLRYSRFDRCASTEILFQMPDAGNLPVCVNRYNGDLRYSRTGRCASTETSATIVGQQAPVASDDSYQALVYDVISRSSADPDDLLDNDNLGLPNAQITSFGGGDAGGDVLTNTAGDSIGFAGGILQINADGSFTLTNPTQTGAFTVNYRISNAAGTSDATVTFQVIEAPAAAEDGPFAALTGETFALPAPGLLSNDTLGSPAATLTRFGIASADENDAGTSISLAGGTLTVNTDGSLTLVDPTQPGNYIFWYRIVNLAGFSDAQVEIVISTAPTAVDDGPYNAVIGGMLSVTTLDDHLLANDQLGVPTGEITRFGVASADETDDGTTLTLTGGDLTVHADGSFSLVNPTQSGIFTFFYRLDNGTVPSDAEVTIQVNAPPDAVDDGPAADSVVGDAFHTDIDQQLVSGGSENLLSNDSLGFPEASITFAGTWPPDAGGNGPGMTTAGGSVAVNADGSFTYTPPSGFVGEDTFVYELTNDGGSDTATVTIAVGDRPQANADDYGNTGATVLGNVSINTASSTGFNVLTNDAGDSITITASDTTSANNGDVTVNSDGTFTYNPAPGFEGNDSFTYTIDNGFNDPQIGTVSLTVDGMIWFVDSSATTNGDGRIDSPFNCLVGTGCFSDTAADDGGDAIFLHEGSYTGGVTLLDNQFFVGEGASSSIAAITSLSPPADSPPLPVTGGTQPILVTTDATALTLGTSNSLHGFRIGNTGNGSGISGTNFGTLTIADLRFSGTGQTLDLANGTVNVSLQSLVSSTSNADGLRLANVGGNFTVTGATTITNTAGDGIDLDTVSASVTFSSVSINTVTGNGLRVVNNTGAIALNGGAIGDIDDPTANAVDITGGSANVTIAASITKTTASEVVEVTGRTGGTVTFSNALSCSIGCTGINVSDNIGGLTAVAGAATVNTGIQTGVNLVNNGAHTVRFSGGLNISTTSGTGFNATGGGTVEVLNTLVTNTVTATTGTAVNIQNTTIGDQGMTFRSVSVSGGPNGITLDNTGTIGFFTVTGDGSMTGGVLDRDGSGGTIQNTLNDGVYLNSAHNVTLRQMTILNVGDSANPSDTLTTTNDHGIESRQSSNITLSALHIANPIGTGWEAFDVLGVNRVDNGTLIEQLDRTSNFNAIRVRNNGVSFSSITIDDTRFEHDDPTPGDPATNGNSMVTLSTTGTVSGTWNVTNSYFTGARGQAMTLGLGDTPGTSGTITVNIDNNTFENAHPINGQNNLGVIVQETVTAIVTIENNTLTDIGRGSSLSGQIILQQDEQSYLDAVVQNNSISNVLNQRGIEIISVVTSASGGRVDAQIVDNLIFDVGRTGIYTRAAGAIGEFDVQVANNVLGRTAKVGGSIAPVADDGLLENAGISHVVTSGSAGSVSRVLIENNVVVAGPTAASGREAVVSLIMDGFVGATGTTHATVRGNTLTNQGDAAADNFLALVRDSSPGMTLNLDLDNNLADGNSTSYVINEATPDNGTVAVKDLATVDTRNTSNGAVTFLPSQSAIDSIAAVQLPTF